VTDPPSLERIATGRSADIFAIGEGRVLRRRRSGPIPPAEVVAMRAARHHGYPVPEVFRVDGTDMEMERVDGNDLLDELARAPWRYRRIAHVLADLHLRLRDVPIDGLTLAAVDAPVEALVHGDLHPGNVIATRAGPVVIDWEGAALGPADTDAATVWLLLTIADADGVPTLVRPLVPMLRRALLRSFLGRVGRPRAATVARVCDARLGDGNMRPHERDRIRRFRDEHT
jgi:aminoglycoside phosphotransferase (APT) family kinase protein